MHTENWSPPRVATSGTNLATCCVLCSQGCALRVDVEDDAIVAVRPDETSPITHGYACNKAFSIGHYARHRQRVQHPLRKKPGGGFERVSWEVAIREIAQKLGAIRDAHSPRAISLIGIGGQANHMDAAFGLSFLNGLGSKRWFNALAQEKTQHFLVEQWMAQASPATMLHADQENCELLLIIGSNPRISNRGHSANKTLPAIARDPKRRLVIVDPRETESTRGADLHLRIKPGGDPYFLLGVAAALVANDWVDHAFLREQTVGFDAIRSLLADVRIEEMSARCGIPSAQIEALARELASANGAAIMMDLGAEQIPFSTLVSYLVRLVSALTGNFGRVGGNVFYESINPPDPRGLERGNVERALVSGMPAIRALGSYAMFSPSLFPEEVLTDHPERIRACIVEGSNPMLSFSDTNAWRRAFERLELLVVIDPAMTETAELADYVLPTPVGYEKWETSTFPKGFPQIYGQLRPPVLNAPDEALPEPEIYARLVEAMQLFGPPPAPLAWLGRNATRPNVRAAMFAGATAAAMLLRNRGKGKGVQGRLIFWLYRALGHAFPSPALTIVWLMCVKNALRRREEIVRSLGTRWRYRSPFAIAEELFRLLLAHPEGVEIARMNPETNLREHIGYDDGRMRLAPSQMLAEIRRALQSEPRATGDWPLVLSAGLRTQWTANTIHRDPAWRKGKGPHCALHLSPADAEALGIDGDQTVRLVTEVGSAELQARVDPKLEAGFVFVPNGFGQRYSNGGDELGQPLGLNLNELTAVADRDPFTGCPHHKHVPCRVERI